MPEKLIRHRCRQTGLAAAAIALLADQFSKWYMLDVLLLPDRPPLEIAPFFNLTMVWNRGISFGMLAGLPVNGPLALSLMGGFICLILFVWLRRTRSRLTAAALGLVIGGALGNIIDRARFGAVADFFDLHAMGYHWPAFNVADSAIFIGVALLIGESIVGTHVPEDGKSETP